jgi:hypothetical protein
VTGRVTFYIQYIWTIMLPVRISVEICFTLYGKSHRSVVSENIWEREKGCYENVYRITVSDYIMCVRHRIFLDTSYHSFLPSFIHRQIWSLHLINFWSWRLWSERRILDVNVADWPTDVCCI